MWVLFAIDFNTPTAFGIPFGALLLIFILFNALNQGKTSNSSSSRKVYRNYAPAKAAQYPWWVGNIVTSILLSACGTLAWAVFISDLMEQAEHDGIGAAIRLWSVVIVSFLGFMLTWRIVVWLFFRPNK